MSCVMCGSDFVPRWADRPQSTYSRKCAKKRSTQHFAAKRAEHGNTCQKCSKRVVTFGSMCYGCATGRPLRMEPATWRFDHSETTWRRAGRGVKRLEEAA